MILHNLTSILQIIYSFIDIITTADIDYIELTNFTVILDSNKTSAFINITIIESYDRDLKFEEDEELTVHLSFPGKPIRGVALHPDIATIKIVEFDGEGICIYI